MCDHSPAFYVLPWNSAALNLGQTAKKSKKNKKIKRTK